MQDITEAISKVIGSFLEKQGILNPVILFDRTNSSNHGDVSTNVAMISAKELKKNPKELAEEIVEVLSAEYIEGLADVQIAGPGFINIFFTTEVYCSATNTVLESKSAYGMQKSLQGQKWAIEHTSPNPNKALHLGHLRNTLVAMSLKNVLVANGATVILDMVDNNRGIAIAKVMYGYLVSMRKSYDTPATLEAWINNRALWKTPFDAGLRSDVFCEEAYRAGESASVESPEDEAVIRNMVIDWESHDEPTWKLWEYVTGLAHRGAEETLNRLGSHFDTIWHEHEHYEEGKQYVNQGLKKGIFTKLEDGAVLTHLEAYNIPDTILLKRDGTSLYITQDIALTAKKKLSHQADRLVWVVGPEQSLALRQLFAICEQLGIGKLSDFTHVSYGYVGIKADDGSFKKMSSRAGTVVRIDDLLDTARDGILAQFESQGKPVDEKTKALSESLALAAVKFAMLKPDRDQGTTFDLKQSIETKGDSGVYVLYTYARIQSILKKAQETSITLSVDTQNISGVEVSKLFMFYSQVIERAQKDLSAHHVAQYLLELTSAFNSWYGKEIILDGEKGQGHKLAVAKATATIIQNGMAILGIQTLDEI